LPAEQRLHRESDELFVIQYDLGHVAKPPVRLDFAFDRSRLLAKLDGGLDTIKRSILMFGVAGAASILLALGVTVIAMRTTRKLEGHFQEIYQRASLTEMTAQLVHDLRNPLAALRANVKALLVAPQDTHQIVAELDRDIVTLNDKLSAFLNLTRRRDDALEPVEVSELIADAVRLAEPELAKHGLSVNIDVPPNLPRLQLQKVSMRDALLNVIINAVQSGQQKGAVRLAASMRDGVLQIVVEDNGKGISPKNLPRLFDAFFTTREDGNGLGLAIVKRVVSLHQGRVHAENRPDGGAKIVLSLPLQPKENPRWWKKLKNDSLA
jgi:signal transduction histidine kinase